MKKTFIIISCLGLFLLSNLTNGQTIRKSWREMTSNEKSDYVTAINSVSTTEIQNLAAEHQRVAMLNGPGTNTYIHNVDQFLPWHRIMIRYMEEKIQAVDPDVSLPYWDWDNGTGLTQLWTSSNNLFEDGSGGTQGLFGYTVNNNWVNPSTGVKYVRTYAAGSWNSWAPSSYHNQTTVPNFRQWLEYRNHNEGHVFINGAMATHYSPSDPIFYIHHANVDAEWQLWHDNNPGVSYSSIAGTMIAFNGYNGGGPTSTFTPINFIDSRTIKVWYARDNLLILDDYTVSNSELYKYTTGNITSDNFTVPTSTDCEFKTYGSYDVTLDSDFTVNSGGELTITTGN